MSAATATLQQSRFSKARIEAKATAANRGDIIEILAWDQTTGGVVAITTDDAGNHSLTALNESDLTAKFENGYYFAVEQALEVQAYRIITRNGDLEI